MLPISRFTFTAPLPGRELCPTANRSRARGRSSPALPPSSCSRGRRCAGRHSSTTPSPTGPCGASSTASPRAQSSMSRRTSAGTG
eukprot:7386642-Prymnesium_polylepis.3